MAGWPLEVLAVRAGGYEPAATQVPLGLEQSAKPNDLYLLRLATPSISVPMLCTFETGFRIYEQ